MPGFFALHGLDDRAGGRILRAQPPQVSLQMLLDLLLGLGEESQIPSVSEPARDVPDGERTRIPQRIERARAAPELSNALRAPSEVIGFLARGGGERSLDVPVRGCQRLSLVERLSTDFAAVVHSH